jgi:hypothetical protein
MHPGIGQVGGGGVRLTMAVALEEGRSGRGVDRGVDGFKNRN